MSEITRGAIGMPFEMAMSSELSRRQFHSIAQGLLAEHDRLKAGVDSDLAEIDRIQGEYDKQFRKARELRIERDRLKAENEALRQALRNVMTQVDGNIRETVRDCVNGHNDVQDIYGYCDTIEGLIDAAMTKEASHD